MHPAADIIASNLAEVRERIAEAATKAGRDPNEVLLVGVTKYVDAAAARALVAAGCTELGESRPQELWAKAKQIDPTTVHWHLVGHLQRNKVKQTAPPVALIHSVDSARLADRIDSEAATLSRSIRVLLEVNVSGDKTKHGFAPDELEAALPGLAALANLDIRGLMTMAHREGGPQVARADFAKFREFRDQIAATAVENVSLKELSMGMSGDFEEAVLEGATIVRVGSALFRGL